MTWFVAAVQTQGIENYLGNSETRHFFGLPFRDTLQHKGWRKTVLTEKEIQCQKNEAARRLLQEWLADDSGYDEDVWPEVKQLIEENRLSPRKRFSRE